MRPIYFLPFTGDFFCFFNDTKKFWYIFKFDSTFLSNAVFFKPNTSAHTLYLTVLPRIGCFKPDISLLPSAGSSGGGSGSSGGRT